MSLALQFPRVAPARMHPRLTVPFLVLSLLVTACGGASQPSASAGQNSSEPKVLTVALPDDLEGMDPYGHSTANIYARFMHIYDTLVWRDPASGEWQPYVAESWSNPDENTWEFKLRQDVKFEDGTPLTAEDVAYSFQWSVDDPNSKQADVLSNVDKIEATDKYTFTLHTKSPDAAMISRLDNAVIVSKAYYEKLGPDEASKKPMGSGPYRFKEWIPGERMVIEKKPSYWGPFKPVWDEVVFRPIPEAAARVTALQNGEVDVATMLPPQFVDQLNSSDNTRVEPVRGLRMMFIGLNPIIEPLKNVKVRQAIQYAIDRSAITDGVLQGHAFPLDGPLAPGMYSYDENLEPKYDYDPQKAKQMLADAGYPDGFDVDFYTPVDHYVKDKDVSTAIVQMLGEIGIRATLKTPEWATFSDEYGEGIYPMYLIGRGSVTDPAEYLHQYFETGVTKRLLFSDPALDKLLQDSDKQFDREKRKGLLHQAQELLMKDSPAVFIYQYEDSYGVSNKINFTPRSDEYVMAWQATPK